MKTAIIYYSRHHGNTKSYWMLLQQRMISHSLTSRIIQLQNYPNMNGLVLPPAFIISLFINPYWNTQKNICLKRKMFSFFLPMA